jgi:hypothetical protein
VSTIRIGIDYLVEQETQARALGTTFRSFSTLPDLYLSSAPPVARAFDEFSGRWDHRRGELEKALDGLVDALQMIRTSFERCDEEMANQLEAG